ncbi:MAG: hypothetical protein FWD38_06170 [Oscillospiraceae bacterium]|nr:hypothetical protein [Oscillospiraceae bacterium]
MLLIIFGALKFLVGDDILSLINKCIILDHLSCRGVGEIQFKHLLDKLNAKVKNAALDSEQEADIQEAVGKLNYRVNNYKVAISSLCGYLDLFIKNNVDKPMSDSEMETALKALIYIAYCHEKINTHDSITKAIDLLNLVRASKEIDLCIYSISQPCKVRSKITIQFNFCKDELKTEVYHALAHFYNERAVFHSSINPSGDRENAHHYITEAIKQDKENSFYSCYGLICHESKNYWHAITIYNQALIIEGLREDKDLYYELLFYLAQTEYALGHEVEAGENLKAFKKYCDEEIHNEDAIVHARIMEVKAELSKLDILSSNAGSGYFLEKLDYITEKKPSHYVPHSVQDEWKKIIYALNAFYYIRKVVRREMAFPDGVREIVFNLRDYAFKQKLFAKKKFFELPSKIITKREQKEHNKDEGLYVIEYKGVQLLCIGDYFKLSRGDSNSATPAGIVPRSFEKEAIESILSNSNFPDVILFTPSESFESDEERVELFKSLLRPKSCVIALNETAKRVAEKHNGGHRISVLDVSNSDKALQEELFLQMGFSLHVYETLRNDLTAPSPLLGLAPIGDSKSFTFQAGEKIEGLLQPVKTNNHSHTLTPKIKETVDNLERTRKGMRRNLEKISDYRNVLIANKSLVDNFPQISFLVFFPDPTHEANEAGNFTAPIYVANGNFFASVDIVSPLSSGAIHSYPPGSFNGGYDENYLKCHTLLNDSTFCSSYCADEDNLSCHDEANEIGFSLNNTAPAKAALCLLRHVLPIRSLASETSSYCSILRKIEIEDGTSGVLMVIVNVDKGSNRSEILHRICRAITSSGIASPKYISYENIRFYEEETSNHTNDDGQSHPKSQISAIEKIELSIDHPIWVKLNDFKAELETSYKSALRASKSTGTRQEEKDNALETANLMQCFIESVSEAISKKDSSPPYMEVRFFNCAKETLTNNAWGKFFNDNAKRHLTNIIGAAEEAIADYGQEGSKTHKI